MAPSRMLAARLAEGIGLAAVIGGSILSGAAPVPGAYEALAGTLAVAYGIYEASEAPARDRYAPAADSGLKPGMTIYRAPRNP